MTIVRNISDEMDLPWYESPVMQNLIAKDIDRCDKAVKTYKEKHKALTRSNKKALSASNR